ncbi:VOC family protein [Sphaerotilaceae bacterium SBD11-9]
MNNTLQREGLLAPANPLGMEGIEFIEYATPKPQALGHVLESLGFHPIARHRSREVLLYRQGGMNVIVNAHAPELAGALDQTPVIAAIALRVRDAADAYRQVLERGAWAVPTQVAVMELNIPAIHGVGASRIYFVDRHKEFSIYDVDFVPIPGAERQPPALTGLHFFGVVQYIGLDRYDDWIEFYAELFGFEPLPDAQRFGILPKGHVLRSPCGSFFLQLVEPEFDQIDADSAEYFSRIGLGTPDVLASVSALRARGVAFSESPVTHVEARGALTAGVLGGLSFELVHHELA